MSNQRAMDKLIDLFKQGIVLAFSAIFTIADVQALHCTTPPRTLPRWTYGNGKSLSRHWSKSALEKLVITSLVLVQPQLAKAASPQMTHPSPSPPNSTESRHEVEALTAFRNGISSGDMTVFEGWDANSSTPCGWRGVSCLAKEDHVIGLHLPSHGLVGGINSALLALGRLQFLQILDLSNNSFASSISGAALVNFSSLALLNISYNQVSGEIPPHIDNLPNLQSLVLNQNNLTGEIPFSIGNCSLLTELNLESNFLQGQIPPSIGRLIHLQTLNLGTHLPHLFYSLPPTGNLLSGTIPFSLGNCSALVVLSLTYNPNLGGDLPGELGQLQNLQLFNLAFCNFVGVVPRWVGNLTNLQTFTLLHNDFYGPIPAEFGKLHKLHFLDLSTNNLVGETPPNIANLTLLTSLWTSFNLITGVFPNMGNCTSLQILDVGGNYYASQHFPSWITSLTHLTLLAIDDTNLHGKFPSDIGRLSFLQQLIASTGGLGPSANAITGPFPTSISNCTLLSVLDLGFNNLTGEIPYELGRLENLVLFSISQNLFTGKIPMAITNLTQLTSLVLSSNFLNGNLELEGHWDLLSQLSTFSVSENLFSNFIPSTLSNCSNLEIISMDGNYLIGEIPASFVNLSLLGYLTGSHNGLVGRLPPDLSRCPLLSTLDFSKNNLEGPLPADLDRLHQLTHLDLSGNKLSGAIFTSPNYLTSLVTLDLSNNFFAGNLSGKSISQMQGLTTINISYNLLSGPLSPEWNNLVNLLEVDISANNFSGSIPNLANLLSLQKLDLSQNSLSGILPRSLASLSNLMFFNASYNSFTGPIPDFGVLGSNITEASFLGNPGLCGAILGPSRECLKTLPQLSAKCEQFQCHAGKLVPTLVIGAIFLLVVTAVLVWFTISRATNRAGKDERLFNDLVNFSANRLKFSAADIQAVISQEGNIIRRGAKSVVYKGSLLCRQHSVCEGMTYLHHDCPERVIHGDLKPANVLLNDEMVAKVADFGISKVISLQQDRGYGEATASKICGTLGYMPPEYAYVTNVSTTGDVYSYGVILLEMMSGVLPARAHVPSGATYRNWHLEKFQDSPMDLLDPVIQEEGKGDTLKDKQMILLAKVAFFSTRDRPQSRPSMKEISSMLLQIKNLEGGALVRPTVNELAEMETTNMWENEDPNNVTAPSF